MSEPIAAPRGPVTDAPVAQGAGLLNAKLDTLIVEFSGMVESARKMKEEKKSTETALECPWLDDFWAHV